jgi:hypothetical protein
METKEIRSVSDIHLAAYLTCRGHKQAQEPRVDLGHSTFTFEKSQKLDEDIEAFFHHKALVDPLVFAETLRRIKSWIFETRQDLGRVEK